MSAKYAVLGLVIERPGYGYQLAQRLEERFASSGFAPSGVYSALDQLARDEFVRSAGEMGPGPTRRSAPRTIYEATAEGVNHFEEWMLEACPAPPLRDELHLKIALCRPRDVPRLIETIQGQELACMGRLRDLRQRVEEDRHAPHEWSSLMRTLARDAEVAMWNTRIEWLQCARELVEQLSEESERSPGKAQQPAAGGDRMGRLQVL
ncbi:MAG TPA: helix-turn-helix transcriptional regulator [Solirubrobacteraceae bacterium]|jgi:DNA-binding PadR family transcriptional regulator|nr:helix-turn-helix transcriptional regulator [Solirubrobacteraceae bacterium]